MASSSKGLKICITKGSATGTETTPTAISGAKPAVVTATATGVVAGDLIYVSGTGMAAIDGKWWVAANASTTSFELSGSDTTGQTFTASGTESALHYAAGDMQCLCLSSFSYSADTPQAVSTATYCDPSSSIPGAAASAGTVDFAGFVDIKDADYQELLIAAEDGKTRGIRIMFPNNGYLVSALTIAQMTWDLPLDGAIGYSGSGVLATKFKHLF